MRASRLLDLIQAMRQHRMPVSAGQLAEALGVSVRTIYRDIDTLRAQGADIQGEAGIGFVLRPGFLLPPLMLSPDEIDALLLGSRWVASRQDTHLSEAARRAMAKIAAVLPADRQPEADDPALIVVPSRATPEISVDIAAIRRAARQETKLDIRYTVPGQLTQDRRVWPLLLGFFDHVLVLVAWCELRQDFRHFRLDRISALAALPDRFTPRRRALVARWKKKENAAIDA